jgi:hypothetical protein
MSQSGTAGFDLVIEISEIALNAGLSKVMIPGFSPGQVVKFPVSVGGQNGALSIMLASPLADLDPPGPKDLRLTVNFTDGLLQLSNGPQISPLVGKIEIIDRFAVVPPYTPNAPLPPGGETKQAVLNFTATGTVAVIFLGQSTTKLTGAGVDVAQLQTSTATSIQAFLRNVVKQVPLSLPIPVGSGAAPPPFDPLDFEIGKINDTSALDRDALVFGVATRTTTGGDITLITSSSLPTGAAGVILLSNDLLIRTFICPAIAGALGQATGPGSAFDDPCTLNRTIPFPGAPSTFIKSLTARVTGGMIAVTGSFSSSGFGWNATGTFSLAITITCSSTAGIMVTASPPVVDVTVNLE